MSEIYKDYLKYLEGNEKKYKIGEVYLLELLPENFRNDPDIIAASIGVDKEFWLLVKSINNYLTIASLNIKDIDELSPGIKKKLSEYIDNLSNASLNIDDIDDIVDIDELSPEVRNKLFKYIDIISKYIPKPEYIDNLAGEMNVDFYKKNLGLTKRLALVKNGYLYKYRKGTADAVKQIVTDAFDQTTLKEWFEYDGEPFRFKITTEMNLPTESEIANLVNAINSVKNARSTLESIEVLKRTELKCYYGFGIQQTLYHGVTLNQLTWNELDTLGLTWDELDIKNISWTGLEMFQ